MQMIIGGLKVIKMGFIKICIIILLINLLAVMMFYAGYEIASNEDLKSRTVGLYSRNNFSGYPGEWIHIRMDRMSYQRAIEVCNHEAGHYLFCQKNSGTGCMEDLTEHFAEICEKEPRLCLNNMTRIE